MTCPKGQRTFEPWSRKKDGLAKVCARCAVLSLAILEEMPIPGDTLKEISDGEQMGAQLRKIAEEGNEV